MGPTVSIKESDTKNSSVMENISTKKDQESKEGRPMPDQRTHKRTKWNFTEMLSDELLLALLLKFDPDAATLTRLAAVNKRFRSLLQDEKVVRQATTKRIKKHKHSIGIETDGWTWKVLGFYEAVYAANLFKENRVGFDFASTDIDDDHGDASMISGSIRRVHALAQILQKFDDATLVVEAHCGTAAPAAIAPMFSRARGEAVSTGVSHSSHVSESEEIVGRTTVKAWGRRITQRVAASSHKFGVVAREGRGWAEVYLKLGDRVFPERPSYYDGIQEPADHNIEEEEPMMILW